MISQRFDIDAESAFIKIRDIAYETNQSLVSLATSIVMRDSENPGLQRIR
jgi:AmiR/NasT family two-component response regulator